MIKIIVAGKYLPISNYKYLDKSFYIKSLLQKEIKNPYKYLLSHL